MTYEEYNRRDDAERAEWFATIKAHQEKWFTDDDREMICRLRIDRDGFVLAVEVSPSFSGASISGHWIAPNGAHGEFCAPDSAGVSGNRYSTHPGNPQPDWIGAAWTRLDERGRAWRNGGEWPSAAEWIRVAVMGAS